MRYTIAAVLLIAISLPAGPVSADSVSVSSGNGGTSITTGNGQPCRVTSRRGGSTTVTTGNGGAVATTTSPGGGSSVSIGNSGGCASSGPGK